MRRIELLESQRARPRVADLRQALAEPIAPNSTPRTHSSNCVTLFRKVALARWPWHGPCSYRRMRTSLDNFLGIHAQALPLEAKRNELLAANLANVDTPNYKARDIDFKAALSAASGSAAAGSSSALPMQPVHAQLTATSTSANSPSSGTDHPLDASLLKYRVPMAPSLDGNTVDEQLEQSAFAENSVRYQATLTFLNNALRGLMTAITGS
jgi:flagellar basal-body rod protein FlgB